MFLGRPRPVLCFLVFFVCPSHSLTFEFAWVVHFQDPCHPSRRKRVVACARACNGGEESRLFGAAKINWVGPTPKITARPHPFFSTAAGNTGSHQVSSKKIGGRGKSTRCGNNLGNRLATTSEKWFPLYAWKIAEAFAETLPLRKLLRKLLFQSPESRAKVSGDGRFEASKKNSRDVPLPNSQNPKMKIPLYLQSPGIGDGKSHALRH